MYGAHQDLWWLLHAASANTSLRGLREGLYNHADQQILEFSLKGEFSNFVEHIDVPTLWRQTIRDFHWRCYFELICTFFLLQRSFNKIQNGQSIFEVHPCKAKDSKVHWVLLYIGENRERKLTIHRVIKLSLISNHLCGDLLWFQSN